MARRDTMCTRKLGRVSLRDRKGGCSPPRPWSESRTVRASSDAVMRTDAPPRRPTPASSPARRRRITCILLARGFVRARQVHAVAAQRWAVQWLRWVVAPCADRRWLTETFAPRWWLHAALRGTAPAVAAPANANKQGQPAMEGPDLSNDEKEDRREQFQALTGAADQIADTLLEVGATTACDRRVLAVYDTVCASGGAYTPPIKPYPAAWPTRREGEW
jgi:hypothetical protein